LKKARGRVMEELIDMQSLYYLRVNGSPHYNFSAGFPREAEYRGGIQV